MAKPGKNKISVREVYKYLMTFPGMTNDKAVGILANIQAESAFYIDAVEMGDVKNKGLGLFQYTFPARKNAYKEQVPDWKTNWKGQIDFAMQEEEMKKYLAKNYDDPAEATESFMLTFEKPKDQSEEAIKKRVAGIRNMYLGTARGKRNEIVKKLNNAKKIYSATGKPADLTELNKLRNQYGLKDNDTLALYHQSYWEEYIYNAAQQYGYTIPNTILENLTKRWAFFDKSYKIPTIRTDLKDESKFLEWVLKTDKENHKVMVKENMKPFETLSLKLVQKY